MFALVVQNMQGKSKKRSRADNEEGRTDNEKKPRHIHHICREICICNCYGLLSWRGKTKTEAGSQEGRYKEMGEFACLVTLARAGNGYHQL